MVRKECYMTLKEMNSYRLTSMEEPGDERMVWIMREVAEEARESTRRATERVAASLEAASKAAQEKWGDAINRISMVVHEHWPVTVYTSMISPWRMQRYEFLWMNIPTELHPSFRDQKQK